MKPIVAGHSGLSVLIIDDNQGSLELLQGALAQPGIDILTANDPEEGLELVVSRHPQIVVTDLMMPKMNGLEVLSRIMEIDASTDVVLMTAHYSTETAVEAIKKGASDYLNKPISITLIREKVAALVDAAHRRSKALRLQDEVLANAEFEGIIGKSPMMLDTFSQFRTRAEIHNAAIRVLAAPDASLPAVAKID